jgi:hypothetical protein
MNSKLDTAARILNFVRFFMALGITVNFVPKVPQLEWMTAPGVIATYYILLGIVGLVAALISKNKVYAWFMSGVLLVACIARIFPWF